MIPAVETVAGVPGWSALRQMELLREAAIAALVVAAVAAVVGPRFACRHLWGVHRVLGPLRAAVVGLLMMVPVIVAMEVFLFLWMRPTHVATIALLTSTMSVGMVTCEWLGRPASRRHAPIEPLLFLLLASLLGLAVRQSMTSGGDFIAVVHRPASRIAASPDASKSAQVFYTERIPANWRDDVFGDNWAAWWTVEVRGAPMGGLSCYVDGIGGIDASIRDGRERLYEICWDAKGDFLILTPDNRDAILSPGLPKRAVIEHGALALDRNWQGPRPR